MNYLIAGGEFINKGSEAMLITAVNEIRRYDKNASITAIIGYGDIDKNIESGLNIECLLYNIDAISILLNDESVGCYYVKNRIKKFLHIGNEVKILKLRKAFLEADYFLDISGYALTSKWSLSMNDFYLDKIKLVKSMNKACRVVLMPQSFGPFNYSEPEYIDTIKSVLSLCNLIYARERGGFELLKSLGLKNVRMSLDSVLIERSMGKDDLVRMFNYKQEEIIHNNSIGIIPNIRLFDKTSTKECKGMEFYGTLINLLLKDSEYVYLVAHSGEDLDSCGKIKKMFSDEKRVVLINHILHSFEFQSLVSQFNYIVASRFHSIVHSYKEKTPALIIGWSEKYEELAEYFEQEKYVVSIDSDTQRIKTIVEMMNKNNKFERNVIEKKLEQAQKTSCYNFLQEDQL